MIHRFPVYYMEFSCIAEKCEATCCAGWQIVVDKESLKKYKKVTGPFKQRIKEGVDFKEGVFYQKPGKRCAFLNEQNLCDMYIALGEDSFCETCRRYPRHIEEFENVREFTLSASCPEAARILLSQKEPVQFYEVEVNSLDEEFAGEIYEWDVVNEIVDKTAFRSVHGDDMVTDWFNWAREVGEENEVEKSQWRHSREGLEF